MLLSVEGECLFSGVLIDDSLKFDCHIKYLCSNISKTTDILFKVNQFIPSKVMRDFFLLVYPVRGFFAVGQFAVRENVSFG